MPLPFLPPAFAFLPAVDCRKPFTSSASSVIDGACRIRPGRVAKTGSGAGAGALVLASGSMVGGAEMVAADSESGALDRPTIRGPEGDCTASSALLNADLNASGIALAADGAGRLRIVGANRRAADHVAVSIEEL